MSNNQQDSGDLYSQRSAEHQAAETPREPEPVNPQPVAPQAAPPPPPPAPAPTQPAAEAKAAEQTSLRKSPALSGWLSLCPGLGQIYIGYYQLGFINIVVAASIITILASGAFRGLEPLLGMFLAFFWLYNIVDAIRRAMHYNQVLAGQGKVDLPEGFVLPGAKGSLFGGVSLVVLGVLLLMHTKFDYSLEWLDEWWPLGAIALGVYLIVKHRQEH
ncbi:MAG: hypothetical protein ABIF77_20940 [bacterium]